MSDGEGVTEHAEDPGGTDGGADPAARGDAAAQADAAPGADRTPQGNALAEADPTAQAARRAWAGLNTLLMDRHNRRKEAAEALGMGFGRIRALRRIAAGPLTLRELAQRMSTDPPYTTVVVDDLVRRGLAERVPHPVDRRAKLVRLTDEGRAAADRAVEILTTPPDDLLALPREDIEALDRVVTRLLG